ncbi:MAG TPA: RNA-binding S4 domain-containing protein [Wenzhouxiangella sp.]|nr:RNA-binding S4 domain-containing protein [Wenzhouxiangella sp.]
MPEDKNRPPAVRLDKWLWAARFFKTRSLSQQAIRGGKVQINGASARASRLVRPGDRLEITKAAMRFDVEVEQVGERRVSAPLAQAMYTETEDSKKRRMAQAEQRRRERAAGVVASDRAPDKRERRRIRRFKRDG